MNAREIITKLLESGMNLTQISRELDVPNCTVSRWYNNHYKPVKLYKKMLDELYEKNKK